MNNDHKPVYSMQEVLMIEAKTAKSVWVLAPDIALGPQQFKTVMIENMCKRNIEYKYLVSDEISVLENLYDFVLELKNENAISNFLLRIIPKEIVESDVTIYDPNSPNEKAFILAPCETADQHYRLYGSALFRMKQRYNGLWRISNKIDLDNEIMFPIDKNVTKRSFCSEAWKQGLTNLGQDPFSQWESLGRNLVSQNFKSRSMDARQHLLFVLLQQYSMDRDLCPAFESISFPQNVSGTMKIIVRETLTCHLGGANSAAIGMCGKMLETALRFFIEERSKKEMEKNLGLGKLIRIVVERYGIELDEGLKVLVNFINQFRITGVHSVKGFEIPTYEQSQAVIYATYDTLRKLFGEKKSNSK
jgi:hypothetical protein